MRPNFQAESVIELPAHTVFKSRTAVGDQLQIERYETKPPAAPASTEAPLSVSNSGD
jgi:hypothetical protein